MRELIPAYNSEAPADWEMTTVDQLSTRVGSGMTPRGGSEVYKNEGVIFIRSQNVIVGGLDLSDVAFIDDKTHRLMQASEVFPFDVLLNITGASIGRCCYVPDGLGQANQNQHVCTIRLPHPNWADAKFLSLVLSSPIGQNQIFRLNAGGNREGLNYEQLRSFDVVWPPSPERFKIAEVLSTVDRAIEQTEALIAKQQRIRTGLMQDLLARGIDEHGNLRSEETHEFKNSPRGRIPVEWEVTPFGNTGDWFSGGTPSKTNKRYWDGGVPWVCPKDMKRFDLSTTIDSITQQAVTCGRRLMPIGTVFIVIRGMILAHTFPVGFATTEMAFNQDVKAIVAKPGLCGRYLAYWLVSHSHDMLKLATTATHGTKRFDMDEMYSVPVAVPVPTEQAAIRRVFDEQQAFIERTRSQADKLRSLKNGLMQDLLTGDRRVTPLVEKREATTA